MWWLPNASPGLLTDQYHPDAAYVSWRAGRNEAVTFDLYTRSAPYDGAYLLTAGQALALEFACAFRYTEDDLAFLAQTRAYHADFLAELRTLRFSGEIWAMPEG